MGLSTKRRLKRPLRVAFVDYVLEPDKPGRTGLSDFVWDMASALADLGHEPHVVASYATETYPDPRVEVHNFQAPPMGYRNVLGNLWLLKRAARITRKLEPDIIHAPEYISTALFASLGVGIPLVLTVPGNIYHRIEYGHSYEWHFVQVLKWAAKVSARKCSAIIAVSREMKQWWERTGSSPDRTLYIPTGIDTDSFYPVEDARENLGISESTIMLLYAGRFAKEKGLTDLIEAMRRLNRPGSPTNVRLYLLGGGPLRSHIEKEVYSNRLEGQVLIRDWIDKKELATWYSAADAVVLPSYSEGFSRTIGEAMACGTPVIGSAITGTKDHIRDTSNGYLFSAGDVGQLAEILEHIADHPETVRGMRDTCINYVTDNLTWRRITERIASEAYTLVIAE